MGLFRGWSGDVALVSLALLDLLFCFSCCGCFGVGVGFGRLRSFDWFTLTICCLDWFLLNVILL